MQKQNFTTILMAMPQKILREKKALLDGPPKPEPKKIAEPEVLLAWAVPVKNTRILIAYRPGTDPSDPNNLVTVNVRANHNFLLNMKLRAVPVSVNVFDLVGPLPRWKGRW